MPARGVPRKEAAGSAIPRKVPEGGEQRGSSAAAAVPRAKDKPGKAAQDLVAAAPAAAAAAAAAAPARKAPPQMLNVKAETTSRDDLSSPTPKSGTPRSAREWDVDRGRGWEMGRRDGVSPRGGAAGEGDGRGSSGGGSSVVPVSTRSGGGAEPSANPARGLNAEGHAG
jgi:hypothetical protein